MYKKSLTTCVTCDSFVSSKLVYKIHGTPEKQPGHPWVPRNPAWEPLV